MPSQSPVATVSSPRRSTLTATEQAVWQQLTGNGLSDTHTAAIMGNLKQEHNFQTTDVAGGLGIAQWLGNRRQALMQYDNYESLTVQVQFLIDELHATESRALRLLLATNTIEEATVTFQNSFERCNPALCREENRIAYATYYLENH